LTEIKVKLTWQWQILKQDIQEIQKTKGEDEGPSRQE
jgi:hypothetical protein